MNRRGMVWMLWVLVLLGFVIVWYLASAHKMKLHFAGFKHSAMEERWYAEMWFTNTSHKTIHCSGYACQDEHGARTNDSLLDFQCTVGFKEGQIQVWPLWFASWLDLQPGEAVKLSLYLEPTSPPQRSGLRYAEIGEPSRMEKALKKAAGYIPRRFRGKRKDPVKTIWCATAGTNWVNHARR
jgi:hypothetical protein